MAQSADQMLANVNFSGFSRAQELKQRLWFTLGALIVYRLGTYVPLPGIDPAMIAKVFSQHAGGVLGMFDMFSGGALGRMTIFALTIMPYITASIVMQLLAAMVPALEQLKKDGEAGRKKINQYTRYLTVAVAAAQAYGLAVGLEGMNAAGALAVPEPGMFFRMTTTITLVGGTMFLMWLGEQITARGIGQGVSLIIYAGIVANLPAAIASFLELGRTGALSALFILAFFAFALAVIAFIVFVERGQRRLVVQYPKRQVGNKMFGGEATYMPLKLNVSGVIPPIFASSLLLLPTTIVNFYGNTGPDTPEWVIWITNNLSHGHPLFMCLYIGMIVFFAFFCTALYFNPVDRAEELRKYGGFIPGIRPGKNTADYLDFVLTRLTAVGAAYLALVCLIPELLIAEFAMPFVFGGTGLLIVVSVTMDTVSQVQSHLLAHQYEGLIKKAKLRGLK
ncbi:MAG: preprotein translocase subunit SecY [Bdellovibrionales bacterium]